MSAAFAARHLVRRSLGHVLGSQTCFNQHTCRRFVVLGSTGSKYHVVLADDKPSCQCMDFRIRRRECKHIKLVLQQLGISSSPADWHQASLLRTPLYWTITRLCGLHCHDELPSMYAAPYTLMGIWAVLYAADTLMYLCRRWTSSWRLQRPRKAKAGMPMRLAERGSPMHGLRMVRRP